MRYLSLHRRMPGAWLTAGIAALTLLTAACGSSGSTSSHSDPTSSSSSGSGGGSTGLSAMKADLARFSAAVTQYAGITATPGASGFKGKTVWYIPIGASAAALAANGTGIDQAMAQVGISVKTCDGKFLPTSMATCLAQAATQGADGVITGYIDYKLIPNAFNNLVSHHIPVLITGEAPDSGKPSNAQMAFYDVTDVTEIGERLSMESVITDSNGKAEILFVGVLDSPYTKAVAAYAKSFVASHCPGCSFTEIDYNTAQINEVPSQVSAALIAHPNTNYVVDELDAAGQATVQGIQNAGFTNKVKMSAVDGSLDSLQRIRNNQVQFVDVGISTIYLGWMFADGMLRMLAGQTPIQQLGVVRVFDRSNVGQLQLTPQAYTTNNWYGSDDFIKSFTTSWGVS
jgi:ABC-type sugar transport system substrate-binding protein